jgi:hypothetical protein
LSSAAIGWHSKKQEAFLRCGSLNLGLHSGIPVLISVSLLISEGGWNRWTMILYGI